MGYFQRRYTKYERRYANRLAGWCLGLSLERKEAQIEGAAPYIVVSIVKLFRGLRKASYHIDVPSYNFVDIGAGRGHALYFISHFQRFLPFLRYQSLSGVELDETLYQDAIDQLPETNIQLYCSDALSIDLTRFGPNVVYFLNNPMAKDARLKFIERTMEETKNPIFVMTNSKNLDAFCEQASLEIKFISNEWYKLCVATPRRIGPRAGIQCDPHWRQLCGRS